MSKINKITLKNFRGTRAEISLITDKARSVLLYGDNGTGKSSFADAVEWFFLDKISHLSGEEVGGTHEGVKNALARDDEECSIEIEFNTNGIAKKSLKLEKTRLKSEFTKLKDTVPDVSIIGRDHLLLRNVELVHFILSTKLNRLEVLSKIIGFDAVTQTKNHLKKSLSDIKSVVKNKGFEASISREKSLLTQQCGALVNNEVQFFQACSNLILPLNLDLTISSIDDLLKVESILKDGTDSKASERLQAYNSILANHEICLKDFNEVKKNWLMFEARKKILISDQEKLKKITISKLLNEASTILSTHDSDTCPLCLSEISRKTLITAIKIRIDELQEIQREIEFLETEKKSISSALAILLPRLETFNKDSVKLDNLELSKGLNDFIQNLKVFSSSLVSLGVKSTLEFPVQQSENWFSEMINIIVREAQKNSNDLKTNLNNPKVEIASKLAVAKASFARLSELQHESEILNKQQVALEKIVSDFNFKQKIGMEAFLNAISNDMNEFYSFMNKNDKIEGIKLLCLSDEKTGEFNGIAISIKFHGQEIMAPKKYLSESNLNCLGLCLFLASVRKFNKDAKFFILDDVISSFDKNHRLRFGQLLLEKFNDYQIILLTHETEWFEYLSSQVKGLGWLIQRTQWTSDFGTKLQEPIVGLKELVQKQINENDEHNLGNSLRRFVESLLKNLCLSLDVPLAFRLNDKNESRTLDELFSALRGRLSSKSIGTADRNEVKRLTTCQFITNKGSHDSAYCPNVADMKAVFEDAIEFEKVFKCINCNHYVGIKFPIAGQNKIGCKCGQLIIPWK